MPTITREALLGALKRFDDVEHAKPEWQAWEGNGNYEFAVVENGRRYPVKEVVALATGASKDSFSGGDALNRAVEAAGFTVKPLVRRRAHGIYVSSRAAENFRIGRKASTWGSRVPGALNDIREGDEVVFVHAISSSMTPVPAGYPRVDSAELFVGIAAEVVRAEVVKAPYKTTERLWPDDVYEDRFTFRELSAERDVPFGPTTHQRQLVDAVRTSATSQGRPRLFMRIDTDASASPVTLPTLPVHALVDAFAARLEEARLSFGGGHRMFVAQFLCSLMAKPLVLLTGLSGSGKTQIALRLGEWFGACEVVAVRPDWTGPESLLGYEDALLPVVDGRRAWHVPDALRFMLRAARAPSQPHLLVLDEMNLAHVERYFADVLSGIESGQAVLPNLFEGDGHFRVDPSQPARIPLPRNLYIVGTVNVDETTYMFSPKVLDRANTIEFRVPTQALPSDVRALTKPGRCAPAGAQELHSMLRWTLESHALRPDAPPALDDVAGLVRQVHGALSEHGAEFGHRTYFESLRLANLLWDAGVEDVNVVVDVFVMQKVLPRLHGSKRKLEPLLRVLGGFAFDRKLSMEFDPLASSSKSPLMPRSYAKIVRMARALQANQFASFADA